MRVFLAAMIALGLSACATADAQQQQAQAPPCAAPEFRQLDFWVGEWDVRWDESAGNPAGSGINRIARAFGDCVIQEDFDGGPQMGLVGHSVSTYHTRAQVWRQTWVDNQGGYFALSGGREGDDFILTSYRINTTTPAQRMVFTDITPNSLTWRWQSTTDAGATWTDQWVVYYTRRAA